LLQQIRLFEEILKDLQERFPEETLDVHTIPLDDTCISLSSESMHAVAETLVKCFDFYHLSTITGEDTGQEVVLLYHFWHHYGITLRTSLPYDQLSIDTLTDLIPGAAFYEREIYEMLGVIFEGHPNLRPLVSADDWDGDHPLRKP
jgi:NADH:ubiquinone oxidoreductase subunit C